MEHAEAVTHYLTANGRAFLCPQFSCDYSQAASQGGSCPDYLVLDLFTPELVVVEVSTAYNLNNLVQRVLDRKTRWYPPIMEHLKGSPLSNLVGNIRFLGLVRSERLQWIRGRVAGSDVHFESLEATALSFSWWDKRQKGLPGSSLSPA